MKHGRFESSGCVQRELIRTTLNRLIIRLSSGFLRKTLSAAANIS
jgi:hypothetical protein